MNRRVARSSGTGNEFEKKIINNMRKTRGITRDTNEKKVKPTVLSVMFLLKCINS